MIGAIAEAGLQQNIRPQQEASAQAEVTVIRKSEQVRQERPVEKTEQGQHSNMDMEHDDQGNTTSRNRIEEGMIMVEQYDENGRLTRVIPPGYLPLSETI